MKIHDLYKAMDLTVTYLNRCEVQGRSTDFRTAVRVTRVIHVVAESDGEDGLTPLDSIPLMTLEVVRGLAQDMLGSYIEREQDPDTYAKFQLDDSILSGQLDEFVQILGGYIAKRKQNE